MQTNTMVLKSLLAVLFITCCIASIEAQGSAVAIASDHNLNTTSKTDDFVIQKQRHYADNIVAMNKEVATYRNNFDSQLATLDTQKAFLEANILETQERLQSLELLNELNKHCVQKYYYRIATVSSVTVSMNNCVTRANNAYPNMISATQTTITNLNTYYTKTLVTNLDSCKKKFANANAQQNYTKCVTDTINDGDSQTRYYMKQFNTQMQTVTCTGNGHVKTAVDCTYNVVYVTVSKIGEVNNLVENCIQGKEFCPPCPPPALAATCPHEIVLTLTEAELKNSTITNPFVNINTDCVRVKFVNPMLQ